ncbi:hypothetical protein [Streptomyces violascens]|uniref:hypothetical protein n=1 Tax=Streptomyces violascens TaxID=67381 RepID=UPI001675D60A|nr:hypothetical protein [Streptomyces violascens]GGU39108.1 hypothetical protein GCM10010289_69990 [Streptomyces violascens]
MPKHHARKNKARRLRERTGAAYTSAAAGTLHRHPLINLAPAAADPDTDMSCASALVAAIRAGCTTCQRPLKRRLLTQPEALAALESSLMLMEATHTGANQPGQHAPETRLDQLLTFWAAPFSATYLRQILWRLPVLRALPPGAVRVLRERHHRVLARVHRNHGDAAVRAVWDACAGNPTTQNLIAVADSYTTLTDSPRTT